MFGGFGLWRIGRRGSIEGMGEGGFGIGGKVDAYLKLGGREEVRVGVDRGRKGGMEGLPHGKESKGAR